MFKLIRITILLLVFASVGSTFLVQKNVSSDWSGSLDIRIIPVVADDAAATLNYVQGLERESFDNIELYLAHQAARYKMDLSNGFDIRLSDPIYNIPPAAPSTDSGTLEIVLWSLSLRWWAWQNQPEDYHRSQIRLYVMYQNPDFGVALPHSTGLQNGLIGLINARVVGQSTRLHNVVITHEMLHTLGARDKYDLFNGLPNYPFGYAAPDRSPLYPQKKAELMARSIPLSKTKHKVAQRLADTIIGAQTAKEIGWIK